MTAFVRAVGCDDFDLYVGGSDAQRVAAVAGSPLALVIGGGVTLPLDSAARFELVRRMLLALRGAAALAHDSVEAIVDRTLAALAYAELPVAAPSKRYEAHLKPVGKAISRKVRRAIAESGRALAADPDAADEIARAVRAMLATARRGALAASGDVAAAAREIARVEGAAEKAASETLSKDPAGVELALYGVSDGLVQVMRELGTDRK